VGEISPCRLWWANFLVPTIESRLIPINAELCYPFARLTPSRKVEGKETYKASLVEWRTVRDTTTIGGSTV
jgi:hypothetical protein